MSLADNLKMALDAVRGIPGSLGFRPYSITVRIRSWSGSRAGLGTATDTDTPLLVGGFAPDIRQLSQRDVIASGGLYSTQDFEVTLSPDFNVGGVTGGIATSTLEPATSSHPQEVFYKITSTGGSGAWYKIVGHDFSNVITYKITVRRTAEIV